MDAYAVQTILKSPFLRDFSSAGLASLTQYIDADSRTGALECLGEAGVVTMLYFLEGQLQSSEQVLGNALSAKTSTVAWMPEKRPRNSRQNAPSPDSMARDEIRQLMLNLEPLGEDWMAVFSEDELVAASGERMTLTGLSALAGIVAEANGICPTLLGGQRADEFYLQQAGSRFGLKILDHGWIFFFRLSRRSNVPARNLLGKLQKIVVKYPGAGTNQHDILTAPGIPLAEHGEYIMLQPDRYRQLAARFRSALSVLNIDCPRWWFRPHGKPVGVEDQGEFSQEKNTAIEHFCRLAVNLLPFGGTLPDYFRLRSHSRQVTSVFTKQGDYWALQTPRDQLPERRIASLRQSSADIFANREATTSVRQHSALLVDDDPDLRQILKLYLEAEGFGAQTAGTLKEAADLCKNHRFDIALVDIVLGKENGLDLACDLQNKNGMRPSTVLIMSTRKDPTLAREVLQSGADGFLPKPINKQLLQLYLLKIQREQACTSSATPDKAEPSLTAPAKRKKVALPFRGLLLHCDLNLQVVAGFGSLNGVQGDSLVKQPLELVLTPESMKKAKSWFHARGPLKHKDWSGELSFQLGDEVRSLPTRLLWWPDHAARQCLLLVKSNSAKQE